MEQEAIQRMLARKRELEQELLQRPGVHGVSISPKLVDGEATGELAITLHVSKKLPADELARANVAPMPRAIGEFVTDVVEHEQPAPHVDSNKYRPVQIGCQIQFSNAFGTLGAYVRSNSGFPGGTLLLTNQHVLPAGGDVFQPDNGKGNKIGTVSRQVLSPNVDGAVAAVTDANVSNVIVGIGPVNGTRDLTIGDIGLAVRKRGRTTELTNGTVISIAYSGTRTDGWNFQDQIRIDGGLVPFSRPGDSGSGVFDANCRIAGLLWGGGGNFGVASPIAAVQAELNVTVIAGAIAATRMLPIRDNAQLEENVRMQLADSADGAALYDFWAHHQEQLTNLVHHNKKVLATWKRNGGDDLLTALGNALQDHDAVIPELLGGVPSREAIENIGAVLLEAGDDSLRAGIRAIRPVVERVFGSSAPPMQTLGAKRPEV